MVSLLISLLPWLLGASVGVYYCRLLKKSIAQQLVTAGTGGLIGYLAISSAISASALFKFPLLGDELVYCLLAATVITAVAISKTFVQQPGALYFHHFTTTARIADVVLLGPFILLVAWVMWAQLHLPAQGWDALDYWVTKAVRLLNHLTINDGSDFINADRWGNAHRHPMTFNSLLAWDAFTSRQNVLFSSTIGIVLSITLVILGAAASSGCSLRTGFFVSYATLSIPMVENHLLLSGYVELLVAAFIIASVCLIATGLSDNDNGCVVIGCITSLAPIALKNTGFVYAALPLVGLAIFHFIMSKNSIRIKLFFAVGLAIILAIFIGLSLYASNPNFIAYDHISDVLWISGKQIVFHSPSLSELLRIEAWSKTINVSYSVSLFILVFTVITLITLPECIRSQPSLFFCSIVQLVGIFILFASLFVVHGYKHAIPENDTGHTRFSLPVFILTPLLVLYWKRFLEASDTTPQVPK